MLSKIIAGAGCVMAGVTLAGPEAWAERSPSPVEETCEEVGRGEPAGPVHKTTVPPDGATVRPGDVVEVAITWPRETFPADSVHKVLDCVTVGGALFPRLSVEERGADNDGLFEHRFVVPADAAPGTAVCDRGFVSGVGAGGVFSRNKTNRVCVTVAPSPEAAPLPPEAPPVTPPTRIDQDVEAPPGTRVFDGVVAAPAVATPPADPPLAAVPVARPAPEGLPFTGPGGVALPMAGVALALGGLALVAGQPAPAGAKRGASGSATPGACSDDPLRPG